MSPEQVVLLAVGLAGIGAIVLLVLFVKALSSLMSPDGS